MDCTFLGSSLICSHYRTESRDNFGIGTNTAKRVGLAPSSWRPERLCYGKDLHLKICIDVSKGNQKGTFCEVVVHRLYKGLPYDAIFRNAPGKLTAVNQDSFFQIVHLLTALR